MFIPQPTSPWHGESMPSALNKQRGQLSPGSWGSCGHRIKIWAPPSQEKGRNSWRGSVSNTFSSSYLIFITVVFEH